MAWAVTTEGERIFQRGIVLVNTKNQGITICLVSTILGSL